MWRCIHASVLALSYAVISFSVSFGERLHFFFFTLGVVGADVDMDRKAMVQLRERVDGEPAGEAATCVCTSDVNLLHA